MELLNSLRYRIMGFGEPKATGVCLAMLAAGLALVLVGYRVPPSMMVLLGSAGGFLWFLALDALWMLRVPQDLRNRLDIRANRPLFQRRVAAGAIVLVWFALVVILGNNLRNLEAPMSSAAGDGGALTSPVLGALTVVVFLVAFRVGSSTAEERAAEEGVFEEWIGRQQERREKSKRPKRRRKKKEREISSDNDLPSPPGL